MKCSSRRNCNGRRATTSAISSWASMKCSSRRNCNQPAPVEVQQVHPASMKCSSRRNCNLSKLREVVTDVVEPQ